VTDGRVTNYDTVAGGYDRRYTLHTYDGVRDAILNFLGPAGLSAILEAGCGTGHWLQVMSDRAHLVAGLDASVRMLERARGAAPRAHLVRGRSEQAPWRDASFDRIVCVNALHHFSDREQFFVEARRLLRPGGGLLTVGLDPHTTRDQWWVYDYFPETIEIDQARFAPVRIIRGELAKAGFAWAESSEADRIEAQLRLGEMFPEGVERSFTSQLTVLTDEEFARGVEALRTAQEAAAKTGDDVRLTADLRFYATIGWV
jgi:ubiquinone/menaquinone biosynthesis C-methylase UbiE